MSYNSRFALVAFLNRLKLAAVIFYFDVSLYYRLISASSESKVKCGIRIGFRLRHISAANPYAYAETRRKICTCFEVPHLIQKVKLRRNNLLKMLLREPYDIQTAFYSYYRSIHLCCPFSYNSVNLARKRKSWNRTCAVYEFVIVVQLYLGNTWFFIIVPVLQIFKIRYIAEKHSKPVLIIFRKFLRRNSEGFVISLY